MTDESQSNAFVIDPYAYVKVRQIASRYKPPAAPTARGPDPLLKRPVKTTANLAAHIT